MAFFEEFPSHYEVAMARNHRWVRGDWQLLPWIFGRKKSLSIISRWKMIDNLRRSLVVPSLFLSLFCAWLIKGSPSRVWTEFILADIALPPLLRLRNTPPARVGAGWLLACARVTALAPRPTLRLERKCWKAGERLVWQRLSF